jgi:hypothetical protein
MIAHLAMADHQPAVQALAQIVQLDAALIDAGRLLPALGSFMRLRHGMDVYREFFADGLATGERPRLICLVLKEVPAIQFHQVLQIAFRVGSVRPSRR